MSSVIWRNEQGMSLIKMGSYAPFYFTDPKSIFSLSNSSDVVHSEHLQTSVRIQSPMGTKCEFLWIGSIFLAGYKLLISL